MDLDTWLGSINLLCERILCVPTSALDQMDLAATLALSRHVLVVPSGRGSRVDNQVEELAETAAKLRSHIWASELTSGKRYIAGLCSMVEDLRSDSLSLRDEIFPSSQSVFVRERPSAPVTWAHLPSIAEATLA